jgi:hypothetical protein
VDERKESGRNGTERHAFLPDYVVDDRTKKKNKKQKRIEKM